MKFQIYEKRGESVAGVIVNGNSNVYFINMLTRILLHNGKENGGTASIRTQLNKC